MIKDIIIVVLVLISLMLITRLILIRRNLKEISRELNNTKNEDYNRVSPYPEQKYWHPICPASC